MRRHYPVRQGRSFASARDRPPFCSVSRDAHRGAAHRGAALRACAARVPVAASLPRATRARSRVRLGASRHRRPLADRSFPATVHASSARRLAVLRTACRRCASRTATATTSVGSAFGDSPIPSARRSSISVAAEASLFSACPIGHYGRPPGPSDRPPGSIPPGAASPRPAPRSPLRGLRRSGDDPWRLRSLRAALAGADGKTPSCRRRRSVASLPSPAASRTPRRRASRRVASLRLRSRLSRRPSAARLPPRPRNRLGACAPSPLLAVSPDIGMFG